jgi:glycolate oxidase iron-sulfur subunit
MLSLLPQLPDPELRKQIRENNTPEGEITNRVGLLRGCIADYMFSDVNLATLRVLNLNGVEVTVPGDQVCCGALHIHNGYLNEAKRLARKNIDVFEAADVEAVVVNSAGCGAAMKEYDHLLADDPHYAERAVQFVKKVKDISEYLMEIDAIPASNALNKKVVYHDACHLCHGQQIRKQPRDVLTKLAGAEIQPLHESEFCCGSAGIYNITHSEMANKLLERKINNILDAGGDIVATGNPGCLLQIKAGMQKYGRDLPVVHTIEILDMAYQNGKKE